MSFRTIVIRTKAKLSYSNNYLVIKGDESHMIHLSEINSIIIESNAVSLSAYLITELINQKIKIIFCDEKHNPNGEVVSYYGCHNTSKRIKEQIEWDEDWKKIIWTKVIIQKILNQAYLMRRLKVKDSEKVFLLSQEVEIGDTTNREGHAAKIYFNRMFGKEFTREISSPINSALDYGYAILLSCFNREIVNFGYLTQLGLMHDNQFNAFNLASDLMEPFRPLVDLVVYEHADAEFDGSYKLDLVDILNEKVYIKGKEYYLTNAIHLYLGSVFDLLNKNNDEELVLFEML